MITELGFFFLREPPRTDNAALSQESDEVPFFQSGPF